MKSIIKKGVSNKPAFGFGLTETLVALSAGTIIIGASAVALRSTETIIDSSKNKANLRQNTTNGTRLLRSEVERAGLKVVYSIEFGESYSQTLRRWHETFNAKWDEISEMGFDDRFRRMWNFYLTSCASPFHYGNCDVTQITIEKPS